MQSDSYALKIGLSVTDRVVKLLLAMHLNSGVVFQLLILGNCVGGNDPIYWCSQYSSVRIYISASPIFQFSILPNHNISLILASLPVDMFWERAKYPPLLNYPILRPDISC